MSKNDWQEQIVTQIRREKLNLKRFRFNIRSINNADKTNYVNAQID